MSISFLLTISTAALLMALLYIILKFFQKSGVNNIHGLTINYITASSFSFFSNYHQNVVVFSETLSIVPFAFGIGILFITVFYIATLTAQHSGIAITSIAGKMSMIIPIAGGILLFNEQFNATRATGIVTAMTAVFLSSYKPQKEQVPHAQHRWLTGMLPVLLFTGSGLVDLSIKLSEHYLINDHNKTLFVSFLFASAGAAGIIITLKNYFSQGQKIKAISIAGGIVLGVANFYSLEFLISALAYPDIDSSLVFSIANVLVVLISVISAILLFKEKFSRLNMLGVFLSIISILILCR